MTVDETVAQTAAEHPLEEHSLEEHPLEGKYIVAKYGEQDSEDEGWALLLYKLEKDEMKQLWRPALHWDSHGMMLGLADLALIEFMKKERITEVYSVFASNGFYGLVYGGTDVRVENDVVEEWVITRALCVDEEQTGYLRNADITVKFWDETRRELLG